MACRITHFPKLVGLYGHLQSCVAHGISWNSKKNSAHCTYATMPDCNSAAAPYKFQDGRKKWPSSQNFSSAGMSDFSTHVPFQFNVAGIHPTHHVHGTSPLLLDKDLKLRTSNAWQEKTKKNSTHQQQTTTSSSSTTTTTTMHHQKRGHQKVNSWSAKQHWGLERIGKSSHVVEHHVGVYMRSRSPWGIRC